MKKRQLVVTQKNETKDGWQGFLNLCAKTAALKKLDDFFTLFLTIDEKREIAKRYLIIKELMCEQYTQREMAKNLKVSISKITRGSNSLKTTEDKFKKLIEKNLS